VRERIAAGLADSGVVNLVGPLGSGKTALAATVEVGGLVVLDGVDSPRRRAEALRAVGHGSVLVVSRRPLCALPEWSGITTFTMAPLPDAEVTAQLPPRVRPLACRLAAGNPFVAAAVGRAVLAGVRLDQPGAVADHVATELRDRLLVELPSRRHWRALRALAVAAGADEKLVAAGVLDALAEVSVVERTGLGLTVAEPFRAVLELAYRWRNEVSHDGYRARVVRHRMRQLDLARTPERRAEIVGASMHLIDNPVVQETLGVPGTTGRLVRQAGPADADVIGGIVRAWSIANGFDRRRVDRFAHPWIADDITGFHLVCRDGEPVGVARMPLVADGTVDGIAPLLEKHTDTAADGATLFLGMAQCDDPVSRGVLFRHILGTAVRHGTLMVSTSTPDYQRLLDGLGFDLRGTIGDDIWQCGAPPKVYRNDFTAPGLATWLARAVGGGPGLSPDLVVRALRAVNDLDALAALPIGGRGPEELRDWLRAAVWELAASDRAVTAEAGAALAAYYLGRTRSHVRVASDLHLSRATYFRRLSHGVEAIAALSARPRAGVIGPS